MLIFMEFGFLPQNLESESGILELNSITVVEEHAQQQEKKGLKIS